MCGKENRKEIKKSRGRNVVSILKSDIFIIRLLLMYVLRIKLFKLKRVQVEAGSSQVGGAQVGTSHSHRL